VAVALLKGIGACLRRICWHIHSWRLHRLAEDAGTSAESVHMWRVINHIRLVSWFSQGGLDSSVLKFLIFDCLCCLLPAHVVEPSGIALGLKLKITPGCCSPSAGLRLLIYR